MLKCKIFGTPVFCKSSLLCSTTLYIYMTASFTFTLDGIDRTRIILHHFVNV